MIFDQFSRYKACTNFLHQAGLNAHSSVLDVGSGPECFLGEFIPEAKIAYVDPLIENNSELNRIKGNVFARDLDEQRFDYVTAIDVLEHVPPENRNAFFERLSVLGTHALVLGFPSSDTSDADTTDYLIDSKYRDIYGHDYPWLEEHHRYGLPSLKGTLKQLVELGWHCQSIGHGYLPWLQELLGFVVCAWDIPNLKKIVLDISDTFNRELYPYDFRPPHYRQFIIASRNPLPIISAPAENETGFDSDVVFQTLLKDAYRQYFSTSMRQLVNFEDIADERDAALAERDAALAEQDAALAEQDAALAERDAALAERDAALTLVDVLKNSHSWRLTKPMRFVARLARYGFINEDRQWLSQRLRYRYHQLPLPPPTKKFFSFVYHKLSGRV
ncbi:MAG: methyltransferase domain-containing protein, partial [Nitrospinales bacterium]